MTTDFTTAIDERCGSTNNNTALNVFSASSTSFLMLLSITLNALIVFVLIKDRKQKRYKSLFYKLLLNITIADLLTGLVADPSTISVFVREALIVEVSKTVHYTAHLSIFFTDAVALCTLTLVSMERAMAILSPVKHFKGTRLSVRYALLASTWILGFFLVLPYFKLKYIRQLFVFAIINITVTVLSLVMTIVMHRIKLKPITSKSNKYQTGPNGNDGTKYTTVTRIDGNQAEPGNRTDMETEKLDDIKENPNNDDSKTKTTQIVSLSITKPFITGGLKNNETIKHLSPMEVSKDGQLKNKDQNKNLISNQQARNQQKATRAFLIMLCVFVATYLPTAVTMIYMNVCTTCNCLTVHIMRDLSIISILSSSVLRPLNFILTLKHIRIAVCKKLGKKKNGGEADITTTSGAKNDAS